MGHRPMNTGVGGMYAPDGYITEAQLALSRSLMELVWDSGQGTDGRLCRAQGGQRGMGRGRSM